MLKTALFLAASFFGSVALAQTPAPAANPAEPAVAVDAAPSPSANPKVKIDTDMGSFTIELFPDKAPKSVENFLQYVRDKHYDGTIFHRVIDGFMVQGGGFTKDLRQKPVRAPVTNEANNGLSNVRGTVAMARTNDPNSATAQFFVNVVDNNRLDYVSAENGYTWGYCVFGKVIEGLDVIDRIKAVPTGPGGAILPRDVPTSPIVITSASVVQ